MILVLLPLLDLQSASAADLQVAEPRVPDAPVVQLTVKFRDAVVARPAGLGLTLGAGFDRADLDAVVRARQLQFSPLVRVDAAELDALRVRAEARSGQPAPDLRGIYVVHAPDESPDALLAIGRALGQVGSVEYVHLQGSGWAPPGDIPPTTDDLSDEQDWRGPDPGIDVEYAADLGIRGASVGLADCEYDWNVEHEDLVDVDLGREDGQRSPGWTDDYEYDQHGTAAIGVIVAGDNGYGALGAAPDTTITTWPEYSNAEGDRRVTAIANAVASAAPGDVVMLEMQAIFRPGGDYGPAEVDPNVYEVVRTATDAGIIVVAAAGNGDEDLDGEWYQENWLNWGDSGAILVGAGDSTTHHKPLYFSSHGSRVNLQGWGVNVFTLGYGDAGELGDDINQAYTLFSGTSSATPMVASAVLLVQDFVVSHGLEPLDAWEMRDLLAATGIPQGGDDIIGPLPNVAAALQALDGDGDDFITPEFGGRDCDDGDARVYPGSQESERDLDVDANCDGRVSRCGCSSAPSAGVGVWAWVIAALVGRRRGGHALTPP